ncbi:hypothetical protein DFJ66_2563 [Saccharothrix variisporea]|uniref:AAA ATPase-like protein n=2 Tax=Saccharothrix variisporea TaxID=543527 RepID=A0A495X854_9PSEU|nr:hypothetical protein DFJ66_2563 [Saccharothrix variisporea]
MQNLEVAYEDRRLSAYDPKVLLRVAAIPEWTLDQAQAAGIDPDLVEQWEANGLVETREVVDDDGEVTTAFWLPTSRRPDIGAYLRRRWSVDWIVRALRELAAHLERFGEVSAELVAWFDVVRNDLPPATGSTLVSDVDQMLRQGATEDALYLVGAAQALGDLVGDPLVSAARRAKWRLDRSYREAVDARSLTHYLPRLAVEDMLGDLLFGTSGTWAAHLLGSGGVGKTMAVRDLVSGQYATRHGLRQFPVARVDFDHVDPRYPHRRPGELLLALAAELMGFTTTRAAFSHRRHLEDAVAALHEKLASGGDHYVDTQAMKPMLEGFARYLYELDAPVLLVLDTCEELAKLYGPGGRALAVDHTFTLLEGLHDLLPDVRVLLAGRRWLTSPPTPAEAGGLSLLPRPYLRVVPLRGFTDDEAHAYLSLRDEAGTLSGGLRDAIVARSRHGGAEANPFELAGYCEWALEEPGLDIARLDAATDDPYIRQRIIGRVTNAAVRDCLPAAVELGRFDLRMIEPYLTRRRIDPRAAFDGLVGQEWVTASTFDAHGRPVVVELDQQLLPRIRAVLATEPHRFPLDRRRLGEDLAELIGQTPVDELPIEAVEGALRLLPVAEAARLWASLERRITEADAWAWAANATVRAAAVENALRPEGPTLTAAIRATQACAVTRLPGAPGAAELWLEVAAFAPRHPDSAHAALLQFRAACGVVVAGGPVGDGTDIVRRCVALDHASAQGPLIALFDALTARDEPAPPALLPLLDQLCAAEAEIAATAWEAKVLRRLHHWHQRGAIEAADLAVLHAQERSKRRWAEWAPPLLLLDRARLARVVVALHGHERFDRRYSEWRDDALRRLDDIDAERLAAAVTELERRWRPVDRGVLDEAATLERYRRQRVPTHTWHRRVPALRTVLSIGLAACGEVRQAIADLQQRREAAVSAGDDPATIAECDAALVTLCRRYRVEDLMKSTVRLTRSPDAVIRAAAWAALVLVAGTPPRTPDEVGGWRHWWRMQPVPPERPATTDHLPPPSRDWADIIAQMEFESTLLRVDPPANVAWSAVQGIEQAARRAPWSEEHVGIVLMAAALVDDWAIARIVEHLPTRLLAEIAESEAELMALRRPERAVHLLTFARDLFQACGDRGGVLRTTILLVHTSPLADEPAGGLPDLRETSALLGRDWAGQHEAALIMGQLLDSPRSDSPRTSPPTTAMEQPLSGVPEWMQSSTVWQRTAMLDWSTNRINACRVVELDGDTLRFEAEWQTPPPSVASVDTPYVVIPILVGDHELWRRAKAPDIPTLGKARLPVWFRKHRRSADFWIWRPTIHSLLEPSSTRGHESRRFHGPAGLQPRRIAGSQAFHVVGAAIETSAGWRMRVVDDFVPQGGPYQTTGRGTWTGERLLGPDDLPSGDTSLVVLQCDPADWPPAQLRHQREPMCRLALEFGDSGVAVLVVPPLPEDLARGVAELVSGWGGASGTGAIDLLHLVHHVRELVRPQSDDEILMIV